MVARRKRAPHMGWEFMWETGIASFLGGALFYGEDAR